MNGPQDRPQAPQSPVPAGDALGPPDTHTGAQSVSAVEMAAEVIERADFRHTVENPAPIEIEVASTLAAAGLLCTPAERALIDLVLAWRTADSIVFRPLFGIEVLAEHLPRIRVAADRVISDRGERHL